MRFKFKRDPLLGIMFQYHFVYLMFAKWSEDLNKIVILLNNSRPGDRPAQHGLVPAKAGPDDDTVQAGEPGVHLLHAVLLVEDRVDDQLRAVATDHCSSRGLTEDVDTVSSSLESCRSTENTQSDNIKIVIGLTCSKLLR